MHMLRIKVENFQVFFCHFHVGGPSSDCYGCLRRLEESYQGEISLLLRVDQSTAASGAHC